MLTMLWCSVNFTSIFCEKKVDDRGGVIILIGFLFPPSTSRTCNRLHCMVCLIFFLYLAKKKILFIIKIDHEKSVIWKVFPKMVQVYFGS